MGADLVRPRTFEKVRRQRATRSYKRRGVWAGRVWGCAGPPTPVFTPTSHHSHTRTTWYLPAEHKIQGQQQAPRIGRTTTENTAASTHGAARRKGISRDFDFAPLVESGCDLGRLVHRDDERDATRTRHEPESSSNRESVCVSVIGEPWWRLKTRKVESGPHNKFHARTY